MQFYPITRQGEKTTKKLATLNLGAANPLHAEASLVVQGEERRDQHLLSTSCRPRFLCWALRLKVGLE